MPLIALALLAASPAQMPVFDPAADAPRGCPPISRYEAARKGRKLPPSMLGTLPAADAYKAVYRKVDGCIVPVISAYGFGQPQKKARR